MDNLRIYEAGRAVPKEAIKTIAGGKLKGMSDISPMWRIKKLTELFGPCGIGWKYAITDKRIMPGAGDEEAAFVDIELYIKDGDKWSDGIPGMGGSMLINTEKGKPVTNDECFKMALTDAISVACKALGIGADVYWAQDKTKYNAPAPAQGSGAAQEPQTEQEEKEKGHMCADCGREIQSSGPYSKEAILNKSRKYFGRELCIDCYNRRCQNAHAAL